MKRFEDRVAIVTGAASGIGFGLAQRVAARCGRVVIADIRDGPLAEAKAALVTMGAEVLAIRTDVADPAALEALADATVERFGKIHMIFNNAGIFTSGLTWEISLAEYDRVIDVNLRSVINGIRTFVPRMIAQGDECHVINTASAAGIIVNPGFASYSMTKHGVVALTEALWLDLQSQGIGNIGVTVVMPGAIQSSIMLHEPPRDEEGSDDAASKADVITMMKDRMTSAVAEGLPALDLADQVFSAIERDALYVLPNFDDPTNQAVARTIAKGRCEGVNPYPAVQALSATGAGH